MVLAEATLELTVEVDIYGVRYITIAQPALLRASPAISNEASGIPYRRNSFFVIVDGPSYTGMSLHDLQHGIDAILRLLTSHRAQHLDLILQENFAHAGLWHNLDSASIMKLADLAARRSVQVTITNSAISVLGAAGQVADLPTINIRVPEQQKDVSQMLTMIFRVAASHQAMPVVGGLHQFIELQLRSIPPSVGPSPLVWRYKLPHGLVMQYLYPCYIMPDQGSQGLITAEDMARLGDRETQLGWFLIMLRSFRAHRSNVQKEIKTLVEAQGGNPQTCFVGVGEGFGGYIRTIDNHSNHLLPVRQRLQLAQNELELTHTFITMVNAVYQFMRPLNR